MILEKSFREKNTIETAYLSAMSQQTGKNWIGLIRSEYSYEIHLFCWFVEFTEQRGGMGVERKGMDGWMDGWMDVWRKSEQPSLVFDTVNEWITNTQLPLRNIPHQNDLEGMNNVLNLLSHSATSDECLTVHKSSRTFSCSVYQL